jgi:cellulase
MKFLAVFAALATAANAHTIWQNFTVNGVNQGQLVGLRAPSSNNVGASSTFYFAVVLMDAPPARAGRHKHGDRVQPGLGEPRLVQGRRRPHGRDHQHRVGPRHWRPAGPERLGQPDRAEPPRPDDVLPVRASVPSPCSGLLTVRRSAKVDNAATTAVTGLSWFKIAQDGLDSAGVWGIDRMYAAYGWAAVTLPSCLAPGNYLLRAEALALHSAYSQGGAQFVSTAAMFACCIILTSDHSTCRARS